MSEVNRKRKRHRSKNNAKKRNRPKRALKSAEKSEFLKALEEQRARHLLEEEGSAVVPQHSLSNHGSGYIYDKNNNRYYRRSKTAINPSAEELLDRLSISSKPSTYLAPADLIFCNSLSITNILLRRSLQPNMTHDTRDFLHIRAKCKSKLERCISTTISDASVFLSALPAERKNIHRKEFDSLITIGVDGRIRLLNFPKSNRMDLLQPTEYDMGVGYYDNGIVHPHALSRTADYLLSASPSMNSKPDTSKHCLAFGKRGKTDVKILVGNFLERLNSTLLTISLDGKPLNCFAWNGSKLVIGSDGAVCPQILNIESMINTGSSSIALNNISSTSKPSKSDNLCVGWLNENVTLHGYRNGVIRLYDHRIRYSRSANYYKNKINDQLCNDGIWNGSNAGGSNSIRIKSLKNASVCSIKPLSDGNTFVTSCMRDALVSIDLRFQKDIVQQMDGYRNGYHNFQIGVQSNDTIVACVDDCSYLKFWNIQSGKLLKQDNLPTNTTTSTSRHRAKLKQSKVVFTNTSTPLDTSVAVITRQGTFYSTSMKTKDTITH